MKITIEENYWECGDGCCSDWTTEILIDGSYVMMNASGDIGNVVKEVLKYTGVTEEIEIEYTSGDTLDDY